MVVQDEVVKKMERPLASTTGTVHVKAEDQGHDHHMGSVIAIPAQACGSCTDSPSTEPAHR